MLKFTSTVLLRQNTRFCVRFASNITGDKIVEPSPRLDSEKQEPQDWVSRVFPQAKSEDSHKQSSIQSILEAAYGTQEKTYTDYEEVPVDWKYVERLFPPELIPEMPKTQEITPSGWRPPKDPAPNLPYYIRRSRYHMPELYLERRRDQLNPTTMLYEYVEVVALRGIFGDLFACEQALKEFLETTVDHPVATYVDELKGTIKVRGADRSLIERFVYEQGF